MTSALARAAAVSSLLVALASPLAAQPAERRFDALAEAFLDGWLDRHPQVATGLGVHAWDGVLRPVTQATLAEDAAWYRSFRARLAAIPRGGLSFERALDHDVLAARIESELLDLEVIRPYQTHPNAYVELVAGSIQSLLERDVASPCERVREATRRLGQVPEVLRAARVNLENPPEIFTRVALQQLAGALTFYRSEVPALAAGCRDPETQADLAEADSAAVRALESFLDYLRDDLLPRSRGDFALGRETFQRKLAGDEMETAPVDSLLARGERELEETRGRMALLAEAIAPGQGLRAALDSLARDAPPPDSLVTAVAAGLDRVRGFLRAHAIVTLPEKQHLIVRATPAFRRGTSFASMESPGVWERRATEAYYNVTPADPTWSPEHRREHLALFNPYAADLVSIHETLPGHYLQALALRRTPSRLRQAWLCRSTSEGWAHYCEQMMIEQGYGGGDPRYELAQLALAAQRLGRLIVGISMHTRGMTYPEGAALFQERCFMAPANAAREAGRAAMDPTDLVYTLGKWRILELRDGLRARLGERFSLRAFHDALLLAGGAPLPVAGEILRHQFEDAAAGGVE